MSSRTSSSQMNGNSSRRPPPLNRNNSNEKTIPAPSVSHDYIIKYVYDTWIAVNQELDRNSGSIKYHKEDNNNMKDFRPFDLEAYWGRRVFQYYQNQGRHT
ncbi:hypothetical protein WA026_020142 [Henosepilachna vigintioctopunctata]|uniref:Uncharacterized protein n=1 Tax=Henosepilachna vigintioctopunctata TaxID=420089 RepID=A0AAW1UA19_9CUCU